MAQLYFYYSAMNAGKSTALLQSSYNYQERGMRTVVYTAEIDDRFGAAILPPGWAEFPDFIVNSDILDLAVNREWPKA